MIAIIDYDAGNLKSVEKAISFLGYDSFVTSDPNKIKSATKVILPGVGAFGGAMERLASSGAADAIRDITAKGVPFLGICLGFQLIFDSSEESPGVAGLSVLPGKFIKIPKTSDIKIPHVGWNSLEITDSGVSSGLFEGIGDDPYVYFVHSYCLQADDEAIIAAKTTHGSLLDVAVWSDNIAATQFHPEKSSDTGLRILRNFLKNF